MAEPHPTSDLPSRLRGPEIVVAPGVYDALSASLAEQAGFDTVYLSGASLAYTKLGRPDIGLLSLHEIADTLAHLRERISASIVVDCDTGFGNALNVMRCVQVLERAGASALQFEDQSFPKRCGHLKGKRLIGAGEMAGKIQAAVDARQSDATLIIGRTDALAVQGMEAALERGERYLEAGADMLFVEGIRSDEEVRRVMERFGRRIPVMANMVEGGVTPLQDAATLQQLGFSLVIFPGALVRAFTHMAQRFFGSLRAHGSTDPFRDQMLDFTALNALLGTDDLLALGKRYEMNETAYSMEADHDSQ
ncbi:2-methylisocitrate lyase-like PEP mutase family enzyme [Natronocella acetinitrilica]|uniref:2-methylisocitrate lyase-like PEP mutase family enzyme n=1 Tax=Natronocella acetinitrilica TaxID=414046 RepID=A0AAE3KI21_9GAMM|nr:oxaloacetate decarboxylase [Natronocella acetinitrilica]MCP1676927.1 2-methylisocitrate lyase-like PEP mutase family enzyme [Natronocella acetinitrilica]